MCVGVGKRKNKKNNKRKCWCKIYFFNGIFFFFCLCPETAQNGCKQYFAMRYLQSWITVRLRGCTYTSIRHVRWLKFTSRSICEVHFWFRKWYWLCRLTVVIRWTVYLVKWNVKKIFACCCPLPIAEMNKANARVGIEILIHSLPSHRTFGASQLHK